MATTEGEVDEIITNLFAQFALNVTPVGKWLHHMRAEAAPPGLVRAMSHHSYLYCSQVPNIIIYNINMLCTRNWSDQWLN